jgi:hypothetical protein
MAAKDKMELAISISLGSSIVSHLCKILINCSDHPYTNIVQQISTFVVPLLVLVGWMCVPRTSYISSMIIQCFFMQRSSRLDALFRQLRGMVLLNPKVSTCLLETLDHRSLRERDSRQPFGAVCILRDHLQNLK